MTITTLEEHDEAAQLQSEPSSPVLGLHSGQPELTVYTDSLQEMKFEMQNTKGAQSSALPDRLKTELPPSLNSTSSNSPSLRSHLYSSDRLSDGTATNTSRHQQPHLQSKHSGTLPELVSNRQYEKKSTLNSRPLNVPPLSLSMDSADLTTVLPTRTRLRRQRRMGSQDSTEDPMERLNRLRARISGALSEVKGVLNKYSTETEPKNEVIQSDINVNIQSSLDEQSKSDSGPIQFRFVRKVRRRSLFNEDEEDNKSNKVNTGEQIKDEEAVTPKPINMTVQPIAEQSEIGEAEIKVPEVMQVLTGTVVPTIEVDGLKKPILEEKSSGHKKDSKRTHENKLNTKLIVPEKNEKRRISIGSVEEIESQHICLPENIKIQRRPSDSVAVIRKPNKNTVKSIHISDKVLERLPKNMRNKDLELKTKNRKADITQKEAEKILPAIILDNTESKNSDTRLKNPLSNLTPSKAAKQLSEEKNLIQEHKKTESNNFKSNVLMTTGKRLLVKKDDSLRRSSIAAVESSKIEPPIKDNHIIPPTQRRPSDSEAILKKITIRPIDIRAGASKASINDKYSVQNKLCLALENRTPSSLHDKQSDALPNQSINVINNETSIPTTMPAGTSLATVIGNTTTAETAIAPPAKTEVSVAVAVIKDSKFPLILDGHEIANVAVPISLLNVNEASSQQAPLKQIPIEVSTEKSIPSSTDNTVNKNKDPQCEGQAVIFTVREAIKPFQAISKNDAGKTENINSISSNRSETQAALKIGDTKKPIHQQEIISAATIKTQSQSPSPSPSPSSSLLLQSSVKEPVQRASAQQVSDSAELAVFATADDICMNDRIPEISETTAKEPLSEVNVTASSEIAIISKDISTDDVTTKTSAAANTPNSAKKSVTSTEPESNNNLKMPELQVLPVQVHPDSQVSPPFCESKELFAKKKVPVKKFIWKKNSEKPQIQKPTIEKDQAEATKETQVKEVKDEIPAVLETIAAETNESTECTENSEIPVEEEHSATPKPARQVKKKVIIKRLQRRLSGSEQTFFLGPKDEKLTPDVETLEKAIAYVTDDEEDSEPAPTIQPLKSCMHLREYHVGDLVMYAERYKKTQIRWKKGRITERITSISYKVDIDGREVSAHINYLKRYTGRKVRFGGKEYLEIDYEQIAEEEEKVRNYSIWNLV